MDPFAHIEERLRTAVGALAASGRIPPEIASGPMPVEPAADPSRGELTTAAALALGGPSGLGGRGVADLLAAELAGAADIEGVTVAGPGFLNLTLAPRVWQAALAQAAAAGDDHGRTATGQGQLVQVELAPDERTAGLDAARAAVAADAMARILAFAGWSVERAFAPALRGHPCLSMLGIAGGEQTASPTIPRRHLVFGPAAGREGSGKRVVCGPLRLVGPERILPDLPAATERLGTDGFRFALLMQRLAEPAHLDIAAVADRSMVNPAFAVPYAAARCRSILRQAGERMPEALDDLAGFADGRLPKIVTDLLVDPGEIALMRGIASYPRVAAAAADALEPYRIVVYLRRLAEELHGHYARSLETPHLRFIRPDERRLTGARLALVHQYGRVLSSGLGLLGISAPDQMR